MTIQKAVLFLLALPLVMGTADPVNLGNNDTKQKTTIVLIVTEDFGKHFTTKITRFDDSMSSLLVNMQDKRDIYIHKFWLVRL